jgi:hypothetical protein
VKDDRDDALRDAVELLANILDTMIPIPGTRFRIGLDPLIGLVPGIGDAIASLLGSMILLMAARMRVPKIVLARMSLNVLLNGAIGAIPGIGDLFSAWFRSNVRNAELLMRASTQARATTASDWLFVIAILAATLALIGLAAFGIIWAIAFVWQKITA